MLDDEINKRINEAAHGYHPSYEDEAWIRMEQMLDEHLPQKKDRRKVFFIFLFTVIIFAGLFFISYHREKSISSVSFSNTAPGINQAVNNKKVELSANAHSKNTGSSKHEAIVLPINENVIPQKQKPIAPDVAAINVNQESFTKNNDGSAKIEIDKNSGTTGEKVTVEASASNNADKLSGTQGKANDNVLQERATRQVVNKISVTNGKDSTKNNQFADEKNHGQSKSANKPVMIHKSLGTNFGISVSAGTEVSGLSVGKAGKLTVAYGAGLSFDLSRKLILRTGFYIDKKIYSVGKNDYHFQSGNSSNYNYLQSIDADCRVYEIPLVVNYNFSKIKNHSWFAAGGLSSYLMNKESYEYYYKYPAGNTYDELWSISNKNKHYFAVLDLSAGYQYTLSKRFSLAAEPYLKLPFSGIGAGKIKLNSAGILFTMTMKPFKK